MGESVKVCTDCSNWCLILSVRGTFLKISIPYSAILDVEKSTAMDFTETIEVKVFDKAENFVDSYFFAYFHDINASLVQIQEAVHTARNATVAPGSGIQDTTLVGHRLSTHGPPTFTSPERAHTTTGVEPRPSTSGFRLSALLRPFSIADTPSHPKSTSTPDVPAGVDAEEFMHVPPQTGAHDEGRPSRYHAQSAPTVLKYASTPESLGSSVTTVPDGQRASMVLSSSQSSDHTYPPHASPTPSTLPLGTPEPQASGSSWGGWLRGKRIFSGSSFIPSFTSSSSSSGGQIHEVYQGHTITLENSFTSEMSDQSDTPNNLGYSILETPIGVSLPDADVAEKFRTSFALGEKETLLGCKSPPTPNYCSPVVIFLVPD